MDRLTFNFGAGGYEIDCTVCGKSGTASCSDAMCIKMAADRLGAIEDILGDSYDLEQLRNLVAHKPQWRSPTEEPPQVMEKILLCRVDGTVEQGFRDMGDWWKVYGTRIKTKQVAGWMPMPEGMPE